MKTTTEGSMTPTMREKQVHVERESRCLSISEVMENQREKAAARRSKPSPWIVRKLAVFLVVLIWGFTSYVYVGRICVPALLGWSNALGSQAIGVGLTVGFVMLWFMFVWSYVKIVTTPPGFAKDHVPESGPPMPEFQSPNPGMGRTRPWHNSTTSDIGGPRYDDGDDTDEDDDPGMTNTLGDTSFTSTVNAHGVFLEKKDDDRPSTSSTSQNRSFRTRQGTVSTVREHSPAPSSPQYQYPQYPAQVHSPTYQQFQPPPAPAPRVVSLPPDVEGQTPRPIPVPLGRSRPSPPTTPRSAEPDPKTPTAVVFPTPGPPNQHLPPLPQGYQYQPPQPDSYHQAQVDKPGRKPPTHPVLAPEYRYCARDGLIKPMRCHHCRACGTCVLLYDHHCPWIGQCVGAYNRKFFVNFLMWCSLFCLYVLISVIALNAIGSHQQPMDGAQIALIVVAALFAMFTTSLFVSHVHLNMYNTSTLERYAISGMQEREKAVLGGMYKIWQIKARRAQIKQWDREWGKLDTEGNIWWLGTRRQNWEYIMGKNPWGWFLPIGRSQGDGMTYPVNPRFDAEGRWRRREEWPAELQ